MSRAGRLFDVDQVLCRGRGPTTAAQHAGELGVFMPTFYRDVAVLIARGVPIRGEPGVGYVLDVGHPARPARISRSAWKFPHCSLYLLPFARFHSWAAC